MTGWAGVWFTFYLTFFQGDMLPLFFSEKTKTKKKKQKKKRQ